MDTILYSFVFNCDLEANTSIKPFLCKLNELLFTDCWPCLWRENKKNNIIMALIVSQLRAVDWVSRCRLVSVAPITSDVMFRRLRQNTALASVCRSDWRDDVRIRASANETGPFSGRRGFRGRGVAGRTSGDHKAARRHLLIERKRL